MTARATPLLMVASVIVLAACSASAQTAGEPLDAADTTTAPTVVETTEPPPPPTTDPGLDVYDPLCVVQVAPGESLSLIADRFDDDTVRVDTIRAENDLADNTIQPDIGDGQDPVVAAAGQRRGEPLTPTKAHCGVAGECEGDVAS